MSGWKNRIVEYGVKPADQFTANPLNPRRHPQFQQDSVKASLDTIGWIGVVLENVRTGYLIDGHERVMQALVNNENVPYIQVDLSEDEELQALASFDYITTMAVYDREQLDALLQQVNSDDANVQQLLESLAVKTGVLPPDNPYDEWTGMPEFENEDVSGYRLIVHFETETDIEALALLIGQQITSGTKYIWYPKKEKETLSDKAWSSES